jgi:hypothetical protein
VGVGVARVAVGEEGVVVGAVVAVAAVVGGWTAGSDFSPHPAAAIAASAAVASTTGSARRLPASGTDLTAQPYPGG